MPVPPPVGRFETSRGEVCWWSGTNISNKYFINRPLDGSHCSLKPRSFSKRKKHSSRSANNRALLARLDKHSGLTRETNWAAKELVGKFGHSCNIYYIHSQIIYHPCTLIGSQQCVQFTNRTIFCSKSHIFPSRWEAILEQFIRFHGLFNVTNQIVVKWRQILCGELCNFCSPSFHYHLFLFKWIDTLNSLQFLNDDEIFVPTKIMYAGN